MAGDAAARGASSSGAAAPPAGRSPWAGRRILLGVTGGIAAYKAVQLARDLTLRGALVDVVSTRAAQAFVGSITFEALTGRPVHTEILAPGHALSHIQLARDADLLCIAPATADFLARAASGAATDLLGAILLATRAPVLLCPAMNDRMWDHEQTRRNLRHLTEQLLYDVIGPATGPLAAGEGSGPGRMVEPHVILEHIGRRLGATAAFRRRRIIVTAGPTREAIDPVRFLTNRSSGRMGYALAAAAWRRGADVLLISGPVQLPPPVGPELVRVESAEDMRRAVAAALPAADALIMAAAVADFRPARVAESKIRRSGAPAAIALEPTPDVLRATHDDRRTGCVVIGFALETAATGDGLQSARAKLAAKYLDMIVYNRAGEAGAGFDVETNRVTLIERSGAETQLPLQHKDEVAAAILDRLGDLFAGVDAGR